ncbi:DNA primase [Geomicrobium sp. JCM 19037]|uniref:toprim domain-containing protein n=1 Tax=Geomicrobium sp. JCM 19037 TaxID=1460634 RepID=UPI00045F4CB8|nr:toprim domain-containing protein [Geomicrobium sp. JCM 19037]GAK03306.1 DNA primase [Geomicrobium sp. JCM 19037]
MYDIRAELEDYDFNNATWSDDRLIAQSPFRDDTHPSFYVYLTETDNAAAGVWGDSGTGERGGFIELLARLRGESQRETALYLRNKYASAEQQALNFRPLKTHAPRKPIVLADDALTGFTDKPTYLYGRGVDPRVSAYMGIKQNGKAIAIPWHDGRGRLRAVKYRSITNKFFWYAKGGEAIRNLIYGNLILQKRRPSLIIMVEAEIDALYIMSAGFPAVAVGSAAFNSTKAALIAQSSVRDVTIMADHDDAGQALKRRIIAELHNYPHINVRVAGFPAKYKDANDVSNKDELRSYIMNAKQVRRVAGIA